MKISLLSNKRICAEINGKTLYTDQSVNSNGLGVYPNPFELFKSSLGCCMGYYVMAFCTKNDIPLDCISLDIDFEEDEVIRKVAVKLLVDERFPLKYSHAVIKAAESCKVKKQMSLPPEFSIEVEKLG
jgi:uncharacterized OsmC-like protein